MINLNPTAKMTEAPPVTRMKSEKKMKWNEENLKENEVIQVRMAIFFDDAYATCRQCSTHSDVGDN